MASEPNGQNGRKFSITASGMAILLSFIISIASLIYQFAVTSAAVADNTRRIQSMEEKSDLLVSAVGRIDTRTAVIATTVDMMYRGREYRPLSPPVPAGGGTYPAVEPDEVPRP